jgi:hypothetical protein
LRGYSLPFIIFGTRAKGYLIIPLNSSCSPFNQNSNIRGSLAIFRNAAGLRGNIQREPEAPSILSLNPSLPQYSRRRSSYSPGLWNLPSRTITRKLNGVDCLGMAVVRICGPSRAGLPGLGPGFGPGARPGAGPGAGACRYSPEE